jgi:predicted SAM-dependent methyltransferase
MGMRRLARKAKNALFATRLGAFLVDRLIDFTQYAVFSPRTVSLMRFDALRQRARISNPSENIDPSETKLHVGCGKRLVPGWLNVDVAGTECTVDLACGCLPWRDGVFDAIVSQHVIEHLELMDEVLPLLLELRRVAKPGAEIWLSCPDLEKACRSYLDHKGADLLEDFITRFPELKEWREIPSHMINSLFDQQGEHKNLFDFDLLRWTCNKAGFVDCTRMQEADLLDRFPEFPRRNDDSHSIYVRAVSSNSLLSRNLAKTATQSDGRLTELVAASAHTR